MLLEVIVPVFCLDTGASDCQEFCKTPDSSCTLTLTHLIFKDGTIRFIMFRHTRAHIVCNIYPKLSIHHMQSVSIYIIVHRFILPGACAAFCSVHHRRFDPMDASPQGLQGAALRWAAWIISTGVFPWVQQLATGLFSWRIPSTLQFEAVCTCVHRCFWISGQGRSQTLWFVKIYGLVLSQVTSLLVSG